MGRKLGVRRETAARAAPARVDKLRAHAQALRVELLRRTPL